MRQRSMVILLAAALAIVLALGATACSQGEPETGQSVEPSAEAAAPTAAPAAPASPAMPATAAPTPTASQPDPIPEATRPTAAPTEPAAVAVPTVVPTEPAATHPAPAPTPPPAPSPELRAYAAEHAHGPGAIFVGDGTRLLGPPPHESLMLGAPVAIYRQGSAAAVLGFPLAGIPDPCSSSTTTLDFVQSSGIGQRNCSRLRGRRRSATDNLCWSDLTEQAKTAADPLKSEQLQDSVSSILRYKRRGIFIDSCSRPDGLKVPCCTQRYRLTRAMASAKEGLVLSYHAVARGAMPPC